jgi:hypothetical protein
VEEMKCNSIPCFKEAAENQKYCSRECSPYGHLLTQKTFKRGTSRSHQKLSAKNRPKRYVKKENKDIPLWLRKWREERKIPTK